MNLNEEQKTLLEQWLDDQAFINWARKNNDEDIAHWERYLNAHPEQWELAKAGRSLVTGIPFSNIPVDKAQKQEALSALLNRLERESQDKTKTQKRRIILLKHPWRAVAAAVVLLLAVGLTYFQYFDDAEVVLFTHYGEQLTSTLPDGTKIKLNANSRLSYKKQNPRQVWLAGEAYFEVKKMSETGEQFQVVTHDLSITVLGTSFNVNTRNDETEVFLEEGKVTLDIEGIEKRKIEMNPGDLFSYSKNSNELQADKNDISALEVASWKEGTLIFYNTPLSQALFEIEDIYGIQFVFQTTDLKEETISGGVPINNLEVTLETLQEVYNIQFKTAGKRYFITGMK
ncbi:MAG: DUF4974 domain-containing protein [Bacteroidetes bacterium]|nr:DUF4974 domain-containing protein [Bacteroidota bacterium]